MNERFPRFRQIGSDRVALSLVVLLWLIGGALSPAAAQPSNQPYAYSAGPIQIDSDAAAYGASMAFQILFPLAIGILLYELGLKQVRVRLFIGLVTWKIGCDFGFFLVAGKPWEAFNVLGLAFYAVAQFAVYHLLGEMLIRDWLGPRLALVHDRPLTPLAQVTQRFLSKHFYENEDSVLPTAPLHHVLLKPAIVMLAAAASWPAYDLGVRWFAGDGFAWAAAYVEYNYPLLLSFTLGGYFSRILAYNLGEAFYALLVERCCAPRFARLLKRAEQRWIVLELARLLRPMRKILQRHQINSQYAINRLFVIILAAWLLPQIARSS